MSDILKKHTHEQREHIIQALIPHIRRHVGRNLLALAASGSYASDTDSDYSDIDLIAFVRRPESISRSVVRFLYDGLAIDIRLTTRTEYLRAYKNNVRPDWPYAAKRALAPLVNEAFVRRIADTPSEATLCACHQTLKRFLPDVQEAAAKVLTAAQCNAPDSLRLYEIFAERLCVALSLLNGRAYTTRAVIFREARQFCQLPAHFEQLMDVSATDTPVELAGRTRQILAEFEELIVAVGIRACETDLEFFVSPRSRLQRLSEGLGIDRIGGRARKVLMKMLGREPPATAPELDVA